MADDNQTQINFEELNRSLRELTDLTRIQINLQSQQNAATKGASTALNKFDDDLEESARNWLAMTKEQREAHARQKDAQTKGIGALQSLGDAGMAAGRAMLEGKKGASAMNDSLGHLAQAATLAGTALMLLIPGGPIIKGLIAGFTAVTAGVTKYAQAANEMADKLYTGYAGMAKAGGAAADGMTGLFEDTKKLGLSMNELGDFVSIVTANSKDLALFGGTVFDGRKKLADMGKALESNREGFIKMGLNMQDVTESMVGYIKQQRVAGNVNNQTTAQLAEGARKYLMEQDALTKLTGMARQEQEAAREQIRSQERFAAKLEELRQQGRHKEAKALEDTYLVLYSQNKEAAQGFADISTNNVQTEAAQKSMMATQGESMRVAQRISAGQMEAAEGAQRVAKAHGDTATRLGATMGQIGTYNQTMGDLAGDLRLRGMAEQDIQKTLAKIEEDRKKQGAEGGAAADKMLDQQGKLRKTQIDANEAMERFVKAGIGPAQEAMIGLANATLRGTEALNRMFGITESQEAKNKKAENDQRARELNVDLDTKNKELDTLKSDLDKAKKAGDDAEVKKLQDRVKRAEDDKFALERGKRTAESGVMGSSTWEGFEQRAGGSLDAAGRLIEDFGKGTPAVLHGREGVITEEQLKRFGDMAMKVGMGSQVPATSNRPSTKPMSVTVDVKSIPEEPASAGNDTQRDAALGVLADFDKKLAQITDRIAQINQRTGLAVDTQPADIAQRQPDTKLAPDALQKWADQALQKDVQVDGSGLQKWVNNALDSDVRVDGSNLQKWADNAFKNVTLDSAPLQRTLETVGEQITKAPVQNINDKMEQLMKGTEDLVSWQQTYATRERTAQENILEITEKIQQNTFQSRLVSDRDRLNLDNFADKRKQLYDNIVQNLDQQFKVTRMPAGTGGTSGAGVPAPAAGGGTAAPPSDAAIQAGIGGTTPEIKGMPAGGNAPPDVDAKDFVKFTGGTGSEQHFEKLADNVESAFLQMARDYNQLTGGKTLQVNSAFRTPQEQANVDSGTNPKAAPGMSLHNVGRALDIQSAQRNELERLGLLQKYGFRPLAGDPPHISMRDGGIAHGPESGYPAELHGTEAVIPLGDGALTMDLPAMESLLEVTTDMGEQIMALKDDMRAMLSNLNDTMRDNRPAEAQARMIDLLESISRSQNRTADASTRMAQVATN